MSARKSLTVEESSSTEAAEAAKKEAPAWAPFPVLAKRFSFVLVLIVLDLWSKARVFEWLTANRASLKMDDHGHLRHLIFGEWFTFMKSLNTGAAFGQLSSVPHLLVGGRIIAVLFLAWMIARAPLTKRVFTGALLLVLAGAAGNLWDNIFMQPPHDHPYGAVRDFIDVYFAGIGENGWHFPTFNVADSCITVGAVLLLLSGMLYREEEEVPVNSDPATEELVEIES